MHLQTLASAERINMFPDIYGGSWKIDVLVTSNGVCFLLALAALKCLGWNRMRPAYKAARPLPKHHSQLQSVRLLSAATLPHVTDPRPCGCSGALAVKFRFQRGCCEWRRTGDSEAFVAGAIRPRRRSRALVFHIVSPSH